MCLGAMMYTSPERVVFLTTRDDYSQHYVDPRRYIVFNEFFAEFSKPFDQRRMPMQHNTSLGERALAPYALWRELNPPVYRDLAALAARQQKDQQRADEAAAAAAAAATAAATG